MFIHFFAKTKVKDSLDLARIELILSTKQLFFDNLCRRLLTTDNYF